MKAANMHVTVAIILMSVTLLLSSCARDSEKARAKYIASGQNYMKQGQYASAAIELRNALKIDPRSVDAYYQLAQADLAQHDFAGAYSSLEEAENQTDTALRQYQKAVDLQPNSAPLETMVGNLYLHRGDLETARLYYQKALEADPNFPMANANLAWVHAQEGKDLDVALTLAQNAKSMMPDVQPITDTLAWVMYKKGNYAGALNLLEDCVQKSPDSPEFRYHLGMTLVAVGRKAQGKEQLEAALRMTKLSAADTRRAQQTLTGLN